MIGFIQGQVLYLLYDSACPNELYPLNKKLGGGGQDSIHALLSKISLERCQKVIKENTEFFRLEKC